MSTAFSIGKAVTNRALTLRLPERKHHAPCDEDLQLLAEGGEIALEVSAGAYVKVMRTPAGSVVPLLELQRSLQHTRSLNAIFIGADVGLEFDDAFVVTQVHPDSQAASLGVKPGMSITSCAGKKSTT